MSDAVAFFVYGTLKRGESRENCWPYRPIAVLRGSVGGTLWQIADYPGLVLGEESRVAGEIWLFTASQESKILQVLDEVEGYPDLFDRVSVECETLDGQPIHATTYTFAKQLKPTYEEVPADANGVVHWRGQRFL